MALRKPHWLKAPLGGEGEFSHIRQMMEEYRLHTVCEQARCPNRGKCWGRGTATFLILGDTCTRNCRFCAVKTGKRGRIVDADEPKRLAEAVSKLGIKYAVITSVDRDDIPDKGVGHFAACITAVKGTGARVEVLIPDYQIDEITPIIQAGPDVVAHNIEVVERLQNLRDWRASYEKSLRTLKWAKDLGATTKSSIMLGLGETDEEVVKAMHDLRRALCDRLVLGQYLQPTRNQVPVVEYVTPEKFRQYAEEARKKGFKHVISEPLARTSYKAAE